MDRWWFLTWRTYGTWLPGQDGFVGYYRTSRGHRQIDNHFGEPATDGMPALARYAREKLTQPPTLLTPEHAGVVMVELLRTCSFREWQADAIAILPDHVHFSVGVPGDPDPTALLREIKSYTSRALNKSISRTQRWWVASGSTRPIKGDGSRQAVVRYISTQENPLILWLSAEAQQLIG
jgi:hypothetical protein